MKDAKFPPPGGMKIIVIPTLLDSRIRPEFFNHPELVWFSIPDLHHLKKVSVNLPKLADSAVVFSGLSMFEQPAVREQTRVSLNKVGVTTILYEPSIERLFAWVHDLWFGTNTHELLAAQSSTEGKTMLSNLLKSHTTTGKDDPMGTDAQALNFQDGKVAMIAVPDDREFERYGNSSLGRRIIVFNEAMLQRLVVAPDQEWPRTEVQSLVISRKVQPGSLRQRLEEIATEKRVVEIIHTRTTHDIHDILEVTKRAMQGSAPPTRPCYMLPIENTIVVLGIEASAVSKCGIEDKGKFSPFDVAAVRIMTEIPPNTGILVFLRSVAEGLPGKTETLATQARARDIRVIADKEHWGPKELSGWLHTTDFRWGASGELFRFGTSVPASTPARPETEGAGPQLVRNGESHHEPPQQQRWSGMGLPQLLPPPALQSQTGSAVKVQDLLATASKTEIEGLREQLSAAEEANSALAVELEQANARVAEVEQKLAEANERIQRLQLTNLRISAEKRKLERAKTS